MLKKKKIIPTQGGKMREMNRREFLKATLAMGAAVTDLSRRQVPRVHV